MPGSSTPEDLSAGQKWAAKLRNELAEADLVFVLLPPDAVHSSWVLQEIGAVWALEKLIIPIVTRRDVLKQLPVDLQGSRALEFREIDIPKNADEFLQEFQDSLMASHAR